MPKLLKFDIVHPKSYLEKKKKEWDDLDQLSIEEYRKRLISLRSNYSDFYTHYLNEQGWEAEEFFLMDGTYYKKLGQELFNTPYLLKRLTNKAWSEVNLELPWKYLVIKTYIDRFKPDVIFARSNPIKSSFWQQFREQSLLVSRLSARLPRRWHPDDWDLLYVDLDIFKKFFDAHGVDTKINRQGFDPRISNELKNQNLKYDVTFVGGMGTENFSRRTRLFEKIAEKTSFKWWGYWFGHGDLSELNAFPNLKKSFQGFASGLDMYQIYKDSKIVLNDYVDTSKNIGFNQRMFEVMGIGGFMLTREAENFERQFPDDIFATFTTPDDCLEKIDYYLDHPDKRKSIGRNAKNFVLENYHYKDIVYKFDKDLRKSLKQKNN